MSPACHHRNPRAWVENEIDFFECECVSAVELREVYAYHEIYQIMTLFSSQKKGTCRLDFGFLNPTVQDWLSRSDDKSERESWALAWTR